MTPTEFRRWQKANSVTVHPGQVNQWVMAVNARPGVAESDAEMATLMRRVINRSVPGTHEVHLVGTSVEPLDADGAIQRRESVPQGPVPVLRGSRAVFAHVRFPVRSAVDSVPWPVWQVAAGIPLGEDPTAADVVLDNVGKPLGAAGEEPGFLDDFLDDFVPDVPQAAGFGVALLVGAGLAIWGLSKVRQR